MYAPTQTRTGSKDLGGPRFIPLNYKRELYYYTKKEGGFQFKSEWNRRENPILKRFKWVPGFCYNEYELNSKLFGKRVTIMGQVVEVNHPLIQHKLTIIRDEKVGTKDFRALVDELAMLLTYEASRDLPLEEVRVKTPIQETTKKQLAGKKLAVVPILRAGLGMVDGILQLIPAAKVGHIGMYRDEKTLEPVEYFIKLPEDIDQREVLLVDPMLATGGSAKDAISALKKRGAEQIKLITLVSSPEGIQAVTSAHPDVDVYTASIDEGLNGDGYIVPGLGDAGDRLFGTH